MSQIKFHESFNTQENTETILGGIDFTHLHGNGPVSESVRLFMRRNFNLSHSFLTPSCTAALEMAALVLKVQPGDEVIVPSYTFVTSASAFALRGAKLKFVDVDPQHLCLTTQVVEKAITSKTRVIIPVHYGGWCGDLDQICELAKNHKLFVVEDAAQAVGASYKQKFLGSFGELGCFSFHSTKNIHCGEGGLFVVNDNRFKNQAEMVQEKGTDRQAFLDKKADFYTWRTLGSSFLMNEISAAWLFNQLQYLNAVVEMRREIWDFYARELSPVAERFGVQVPRPNSECQHNAHLFYLIFPSEKLKQNFKSFMLGAGIQVLEHYVPLHSSPMGQRWGEAVGNMETTLRAHQGLVRLPIYPQMIEKKEYVVEKILEFWSK